MLSPDMDIEADLGIDSIKRVEILSSFEEKMPGLPSVSPEMMGTLKTLGQIAEYLDRSAVNLERTRGGVITQIPESRTGQPGGSAERRHHLPPDSDGKRRTCQPSFRQKILIADDKSGLGEILVSAFEKSNVEAILMSPEQSDEHFR